MPLFILYWISSLLLLMHIVIGFFLLRAIYRLDRKLQATEDSDVVM